MGNTTFWWNNETKSDQILRTIIQKTGELGRLPTFEEVKSIARTFSMLDVSFYFGSFPEAMEQVAGLLFGHPGRQFPEELVAAQRSLSPEEQKIAKREQREKYEERLKLLSQVGGLQKLRQARQDKNFRLGAPADKVTRLPPPNRRSRLAAEAAAKRKAEEKPRLKPASVSSHPKPKPERCPPPRSQSRPASQSESAPLAPSVVSQPTSAQKEVSKMSRPKGVRYTQDDFLQTIAHLKAHFGDRLAPQDQIVHYLDEHRELVSYRTMILRLGPKHQWLAILDGTLPFPEPKKSRKSQSDSQPEPAQSSETPEASALASEPKPEPQLEPQAEPAMAPIEENPVTNPQDETNQSQISIPLPAAAVSGKLKLEVELDERALTLRIIF